MALALRDRADEILSANARDVEAGAEAGLTPALIDRLTLTEQRLEGIADAVLEIRALADPVGETIDGHRLPNGLDLRRVRVPLGGGAGGYEARPDLAIGCSALCPKSGQP